MPNMGTQIMNAWTPPPPEQRPPAPRPPPPSYPYPPFQHAEWTPPLEEIEPADYTRVAPEGSPLFEEEPLVLSVRVESSASPPVPMSVFSRLRETKSPWIAFVALLVALAGWASFALDAPIPLSVLLMVVAIAGGIRTRRHAPLWGWAATGLAAFWLGLVAAALFTSWIVG